MPERARRGNTPLLTPQTERPEWLVIDAAGLPIGRLASRVARLLMGKHKPTWTPHVCCGDHVVVVNASKVRITGAAAQAKPFYSSHYMPGHLKAEPASHLLARRPEKAVRLVIERMLPKTTLGTRMAERLKIYRDAEHPHKAQAPRQAVLS